MARRGRRLQKAALAVAGIPLLVLIVAVAGAVVGLFDRAFAFDVLVMGVALYSAGAAALFALVALGLSLGDLRRRAPWALAALLLAGGLAAGILHQDAERRSRAPVDVSTDLAQLPGSYPAAGEPGTCPGLAAIPRQLLAEQASEALLDAGFVIGRASLFEVEASREAFWFGGRHRAAVRIRPGRTDLRVTGLYPGSGPASCRLALRLQEELQARR